MSATEEKSPEGVVMPPPILPEPKMPQAAAPTDDVVVQPEMLKTAEQQLATHLNGSLNPALAQGLMLTLLAEPSKGAIAVKLRLQGPMVAANPDIGLKAVEALKGLDAFAPFFQREKEKPHAQGSDKPDTIDIHIPGLSKAEYLQLMQSLSTPQPQVNAADKPATTIKGPAIAETMIKPAAMGVSA